MFDSTVPSGWLPASTKKSFVGLWLALMALCALSATATAADSIWTIESATLRAELRENGAVRLHDKRTRVDWESAVPAAPRVTVKTVALGSNQSQLDAAIEIDGEPWTLHLRLTGDAAALEIELGAPVARVLQNDVAYPFGWRAPASDWRAAIPQKTGLLFRVEDAANPKVLGHYWTFDGPGLSMPWAGLTNLEGGLMLLLLTPEDSGVDLEALGTDTAKVFSLQPVWRPSLGTVRYARKLQVRLFSTGGYVAMAKAYRQHLIARGEFKTLRQKALARPALNKLIGALDVHLRGNEVAQKQTVEHLETQGVRRLLINTGAGAATIAWMKDRGHLLGSYRIYTDIHPPRDDTRAPLPLFLARGYPDDAYTLREGGPVRGFAFSDTHRTTYRSSVLQLPLMTELVPPLLHGQGYEAIFLDVTTSMPLREDYHPRHLLDRRADQAQRLGLLHFTTSQGVVTGSEDGSSWAAQHVDYFEGMTMPRRFGYLPGITAGNYTQSFDLNDEYRSIDLNEQVRAPLWDLVFHDAVVSTWRWNFGRNRYANAADWDKHDLLEILIGNLPIFVLDLDLAKTHGARIGRTYREVCEWHARIGWDELVDHRALTPDRTVQESRFSSGWAVVVNFSSGQSFALTEGESVPPLSFAMRRWVSPAQTP